MRHILNLFECFLFILIFNWFWTHSTLQIIWLKFDFKRSYTIRTHHSLIFCSILFESIRACFLGYCFIRVLAKTFSQIFTLILIGDILVLVQSAFKFTHHAFSFLYWWQSFFYIKTRVLANETSFKLNSAILIISSLSIRLDSLTSKYVGFIKTLRKFNFFDFSFLKCSLA